MRTFCTAIYLIFYYEIDALLCARRDTDTSFSYSEPAFSSLSIPLTTRMFTHVYFRSGALAPYQNKLISGELWGPCGVRGMLRDETAGHSYERLAALLVSFRARAHRSPRRTLGYAAVQKVLIPEPDRDPRPLYQVLNG